MIPRAMTSCALALTAVWTLALGCSSDGGGEKTGFNVEKYDKTCTTPADCVIVFSGNPCSCSCDVAAVSQTAALDVQADRNAFIKANCPEGPPDCGACASPPATTCNGGKCGT